MLTIIQLELYLAKTNAQRRKSDCSPAETRTICTNNQTIAMCVRDLVRVYTGWAKKAGPQTHDHSVKS